MKTINSLSGGRSSCYMAVKAPAEMNVFAVVLTEQKEAQPKDPGLLRRCKEKTNLEFFASRELDQTLKNMLDLEDYIGKEIKWVHGESYDSLIRRKGRLPNKRIRFCTEELKVRPIFEYCFFNMMEDENDVLLFQIGLRRDEKKRAEKLGNCSYEKMKFPYKCDLEGTYKGNQRWKTLQYRIMSFPLIEKGIEKKDVQEFWKNKGWKFPEVSNCDFCFFHTKNEMIKQKAKNPQRFKWWVDQEEKNKATFLDDKKYKDILSQSEDIQLELNLDSSCICTD